MADHPPNEESSFEEAKHRDIVNCPEDFAYAAGIIDGEGCVSLAVQVNKRGTKRYHVRLYVKMVDVGAILFLIKKFGGHFGKVRNAGRRRDCYQWYLNTSEDILYMCKKLLPFAKVKHKQLQLAIEFLAEPSNEKREIFYQLMKALNRRGR